LFSETVQIKNPCTSSERRKIVELAKKRIIEEYGFCFDGNFDNSDYENSSRERKENENSDDDSYRNGVNEGCVNDDNNSNNNNNNNDDDSSNNNNNNNSKNNINDNDSNSKVNNIHNNNTINKKINDKDVIAKINRRGNNNATKNSIKIQKNIQQSINYFFDDETLTSITDHLTSFPTYSLYLEAILLLRKIINFKLVKYSRGKKTEKIELKNRKSIEKTVKNNIEQKHTEKNGLFLSFPLVYGQTIAKNALSESLLWPRKLSSLYRTLCPSGTYN
jgi:hypothetical protein